MTYSYVVLFYCISNLQNKGNVKTACREQPMIRLATLTKRGVVIIEEQIFSIELMHHSFVIRRGKEGLLITLKFSVWNPTK